MNKELKIGMIGLDTSHVLGFCGAFNDRNTQYKIPGARIEKAFPGGSAAFSLSRDRVAGFTADAKEKFGVEIVDSIADLADMDAFLLLSVDGAQHLEQFTELSRYGKCVFIDKPFACNYSDARAICELSAASGTPVMTASSIRFVNGIAELVPQDETVGAVEGFGPMALLSDYRDYFWYGIHSVEAMYSFIGKGFVSVEARCFEQGDILVGRRADGRIGTVFGTRCGASAFGVRIATNKRFYVGLSDYSVPYIFKMAGAIDNFFRTRVPAVDPAESLETIAFLEAASRSRAEGGRVVEFSEFVS